MNDPAIATVLADLGFVSPEARDMARAALEAAGLTRPGKQAISAAKLPRVREVLAERFALSCAACAGDLKIARPEAALLIVADERCENCGGSDHRAAAQRFLAACRVHRVRRVVVVGGNPTSRQALGRHLEGLELQLIDGTRTLNATRARQSIEWADLVLVWGTTQLDHKVSTLFTSTKDAKVITAAKRGIGGLLDAGTTHLSRETASVRRHP